MVKERELRLRAFCQHVIHNALAAIDIALRLRIAVGARQEITINRAIGCLHAKRSMIAALGRFFGFGMPQVSAPYNLLSLKI